MKKFTIRLGERKVIRITRGESPARGLSAPQNGILPVDPDEMLDGRRRRGGTITLYDLAIRMVDGVETPIDQYFRWTAFNNPSPLSNPSLAALDTALLTGDFRQSRQLDFDPSPQPAIPSGVSVAGDEHADTFDFVEVDGWRGTPAGAGYFKHTRHVSGFYESDPRYYHNILLHSHPERFKLTATPDYGAPAVDFPVVVDKSKVGVYLVPHRPKFRLVYTLKFQYPNGSEAPSGIGAGGPFDIELTTIDRIPVRPAIYPYFPQLEMAGLIQAACEPAWAPLYATPEANALASMRAHHSNPGITISERYNGRVIRDDERINVGGLMGILTVGNDTFYVWSTATTFYGTSFNSAVRSTQLVAPTSWGVQPTDVVLNPFG
jgi:hypothetical protein